VVDVLSSQTMQAAKDLGHDRIVMAGGVAANSRLRSRLQELTRNEDKTLFQPDLRYCTDNAAMIAYMGHWKYKNQLPDRLDIAAIPNLKLSFGG
jgi:N6-L-threonylcarbamoyladenine synthase